MLKVFRDAFKISFDNLILFTPPLVFMMLVLLYFGMAEKYMENTFSLILTAVVILVATSIFMAGWFYMIMCAIFNFKNKIVYEKSSDTFTLLKQFIVGLGDYFKPCLLFSILTALLFSIVLVISYYISLGLFGSSGIFIAEFLKDFSSFAAFLAFLEDLTINQIRIVYGWSAIFTITMFLYSLLTLFWPAEIFYNKKNVFKALKSSVLILFKKPQIIGLFLLIIILNNILMMLNILSLMNPFALLFMTLVYVYFIVYIFVLLFLYYEQKIQSNSNSSTDSNW